MQFTFYHGTSSLFLPSILEHGLGMINPSIDLKTLELLKLLYNDAERYLANHPQYIALRQATFAMVHQSTIDVKTPDGYQQTCHFTHQNIYLAISETRAVVHAVMNAYGSEIVSRCVKIYALLKQVVLDYELPEHLDLLNLESLLESRPYPVIIKIKGTDIDEQFLEKEDGKTAIEALNFLRSAIPLAPDELKPELLQYCNFQLLSPIPREKMKAYKIRHTGSFNHDFDYHLLSLDNNLL